MSRTTIEWTDETWNPPFYTGCTKVGPGCEHCYAERMAKRLRAMGMPGYKNAFKPTRHTGHIGNDKSRLYAPFRWKKPRLVFVNSMFDLFHKNITDGEILAVLDVIFRTPQHIYQVLTKRPERMLEFFTKWQDVDEGNYEPKLADGPEAVRKAHTSGRAQMFASMLEAMGTPQPGYGFPYYDWMEGMRWWSVELPKNLWLGVSVENQVAADERIPMLLQIPAAVRFLSCEPLLGPVLLDNGVSTWLTCNQKKSGGYCCDSNTSSEKHFHGIDWVIAGGESGAGSRPMHPAWIRSLRDQCAAAGVPFFFKQWGEWLPWFDFIDNDIDDDAEQSRFETVIWDVESNEWDFHGGGWMDESGCDDAFGPEQIMGKVGKKKAGRILDGVEHNEFPQTYYDWLEKSKIHSTTEDTEFTEDY